MNICEVCGEKATIMGMLQVDDFDCFDNRHYISHFFCEQHYNDWVNKEIEIPIERLEILP